MVRHCRNVFSVLLFSALSLLTLLSGPPSARAQDGLTSEQWITSFYTAYWNRAPDPEGHAYWTGLYSQGRLSIPQVAENFALSAEAKAAYPYFKAPEAATPEQVAEFVRSVYRNLLDREAAADDPGVQYWVRELQSGASTPGAVIGHIINAAMALGGADWWVIQDKVDAAGEVDPIRMVLEASWQRPEIVKINVLRDLLANFFPDTADGLPSVYDLRTLGRSSPVRSQTECSTCWAFAAMGSLESFLLPLQNRDFSEDHMAAFFRNCGGGATQHLATPYLAGWFGPVLEEDFDVQSGSTQNPPVRAHVQRVYYLPEKQGPMDNFWHKFAIMHFGEIYMSVGWRGLTNPQNNAYYYPGGTKGGAHAVSLVGWDDFFDRNKFTYTITVDGQQQTYTPPGNGAFIAKNNYGPDFGEQGFYYISYYDGIVASNFGGAAFTAESVDNYKRIYQHDTRYGPRNYLSSKKGANVFTAEANEDLAAVAFYNRWGPRDFQVEIHLSPDQPPVNSAGPAAVVKTRLPMGGYYTVQLPQKIRLTAGQKFSVVLSHPDPKEYPLLALEEAYTFDRPDHGITANPGESYYIDLSGEWRDLHMAFQRDTLVAGTSNLCIKAFTTPRGAVNIPDLVETPETFPDLIDGPLPSVPIRKTGRQYDIFDPAEIPDVSLVTPFVTATSPVRNQNINYLGLDTVTITFGLSIRPGPNYWGITAMSPGENKFVFNAITNNTLTLKAITPFGSEQLGGTVWTIRIPKDAVLNSAGDPMTQDYSFSFTVTGVN